LDAGRAADFSIERASRRVRFSPCEKQTGGESLDKEETLVEIAAMIDRVP
jgi:hypothetical protein